MQIVPKGGGVCNGGWEVGWNPDLYHVQTLHRAQLVPDNTDWDLEQKPRE